MTRYAGGQTLLGGYKSPTSNSIVATATLRFSSPTVGVLSVTFADLNQNRTIQIERFPISTPTSFTPSTGVFESGWWWNESEGGRGFYVEVQGSQAFIGGFMYDDAGQPTWYVSNANLTGNLGLTGTLQQFGNGQSLNGNYKAPVSANANAGTLSMTFTSGNTANMVLPNGKSVALKRFFFGTPTTAKAEGVYIGNIAGGTAPSFQLLVLESDEFWAMYGTNVGGVFYVSGLIQGQGVSNSGTFTSVSGKDFGVSPAVNGTFSGQYIPGSSFSGSVASSQGQARLSGTAIPIADFDYNMSADLAQLTGGWVMSGLDGTVTVLNVSSGGNFTASNNGCLFSGRISPRPSGKNVFNVTATFGASPCVLAGQTAAGIAINSPISGGRRQLILAGVDNAKTIASVVFGNRNQTVQSAIGNIAPLGNAGAGQSVLAGSVVALTGAASTDPNGDVLRYAWNIVSKPTGSNATISNPASRTPTFRADLPGPYTFALLVDDGALFGQASTVTVTASAAAAPDLLLYGGINNSVYLGCITCSPTRSDSLCNSFGTFGNPFSSLSIWNQFGTYGNQFATYSPWNSFSSFGPAIFGTDNLFYGVATTNLFRSNRTTVPDIVSILNFYSGTSNLAATRTFACGS